MKDPILKTKKAISVFCQRKESPLQYADLLTYCHRADQHRYNCVPTVRRVAKATGLREPTVSASTGRLRQLGLVTADASVSIPCLHLDWFVFLDALKELSPDGPETQWVQNWKSLVRQPGSDNPLTVPAVMIYSAIRHSVYTNWKPASGWTHEYLSLLTGTNTKTVASALATLEEFGFLAVQDGMRFKLYQLRDGQGACFADKQVWSGNSSEPDEIVEDYGPSSERLDQSRQARLLFEKYMERWDLSATCKQKIMSAVMKHSGWEKRWQDWAFELISKVMEPCPRPNGEWSDGQGGN